MKCKCPHCGGEFQAPFFRPRRIKNVAERFWDKVDKNGPTPAHAPELGPCWLWLGHLTGGGYAQFSVGQKQFPAHKFSWMMAHGPVKDGKLIRHRCDVRHCVNPAHLIPGSQLENMRDMISRGRARPSRGEKNGGAKLTNDQAVSIKKEYQLTSATQTDLGKRYGVSRRAIGMIVLGQRWKHVTT